ncbi:MAG: hypothetical protein AB7S77_00955 [Desulfatirhabdiaceae bacterium]
MKDGQSDSLQELFANVSQAVELAKEWKEKNFQSGQLPDMIKKQFDRLYQILPTFGDDADFQNALPVYLNIAKFLKNRHNSDFLISLGTALFLCHKKEITDLAEIAQKEILKMAVDHKKADPYQRETRIYYNRDGSPTEYCVKESISRDDLISDVREEFLRTDSETVSIKLFPAEG